MSQNDILPRSPELMSAGDTALLVVDIQEKLVPAICDHARLVWNARRLIDGAKILGLPVAATEQYPQGLGPTVAELAERLDARPSKLTFSCGGCPQIFADLRGRGIHKLLVCGIEAHVCVQQTVLDLLADGWRVYRGCGRRRVAAGDRLSHGAAAHGLGRGNVDHHRSGLVRSGAKRPARRSSARSAGWRRKSPRAIISHNRRCTKRPFWG